MTDNLPLLAILGFLLFVGGFLIGAALGWRAGYEETTKEWSSMVDGHYNRMKALNGDPSDSAGA